MPQSHRWPHIRTPLKAIAVMAAKQTKPRTDVDPCPICNMKIPAIVLAQFYFNFIKRYYINTNST